MQKRKWPSIQQKVIQTIHQQSDICLYFFISLGLFHSLNIKQTYGSVIIKLILFKLYKKLMKRGKRQIIERPIFDQQNQEYSNQKAFGFNNNFDLGHEKPGIQPIHKQQQKNLSFNKNTASNNCQNKINKQEDSKITTASQPQISNVQNKASVAINEDNDRKKRLQMLKQKYIKAPVPTQIKEPQKKQLQNYNNQNSITAHITIQKHQVRQPQVKKYQYNQPTQNNTQKTITKIAKKQQNEQSQDGNNFQSQSPVSKPTHFSHNTQPRVPPPPPSVGTKRKNPPPPPPPKVQTQIALKQQQQAYNKSQQIKQPRAGNNYNLKSPPKQKTPTLISKIPQKQAQEDYQKKQAQQPYQQQQNNKTFDELLQKWLSNQPDSSYKPSQNSNKIIQNIITQLTGNQESDFIRGLVKYFVVLNDKGYSEDQFTFILQKIGELSEVSNFTKLFLSIKCGVSALQKYCKKQFSNNNSLHQLTQLLIIKQQLNLKQLNQFIRFYLSNFKPSQEALIILVQLAPSCPSLHEYLLSYQFQSSVNVVDILIHLKNKLDESMCPIYFKLINSILNDINSQSILQGILKLVNGVGFQSAYQLKKDTKLKIIQKIDKSTNQNTGKYRQVTRKQTVNEPKNFNTQQSQKQKSLGVINLMGYVNQAFKKITNQGPQKQQSNQQKKVIQEPTQKVQWDPVLRRYLINGKVPQDEGNSNVNPTQNQAQGQPKKKVPPPPPKIGRKNNPPKEPQQIQQPKAQTEPQITNSNPFAQAENTEEGGSFPSVPRMGLKGINKKSKIQARYT